MERILVESQGRILIPKKIREHLGLRSGEEVGVEVVKEGLLLKIPKSAKEFSAELKGCVKESKIKPLDVKKIWRM